MVLGGASSYSLPFFYFSVIGNNAFLLHRQPLIHNIERSKRTSQSYKTIDPIENESMASSPPSNPLDGVDESVNKISNIIDHLDSGDDIVEDNAWQSATRTLGSLFLRQEDADRDKNVDVFGRPLAVGQKIEDSDASPFYLHENSFAKYLMDLKFQEEQNRERAAEHHSIKSNNAWRDNSTKQKVSREIEIDQVSGSS